MKNQIRFYILFCVLLKIVQQNEEKVKNTTKNMNKMTKITDARNNIVKK